MEKLKTFFKTYYMEVIFTILFIVLLGIFALPILNLELATSITRVPGTFPEMDYGDFEFSFYQLIVGGTFGVTTLIPDGVFITGLIFVIASFILMILSLVFKKQRNLLSGFGLLALIITLIFVISAHKFLPTYDYLYEFYWPEEEYASFISGADIIMSGFLPVVVVLILMIATLGLGLFKDVKFSIRDMTEIAMLVGLALVLDELKLWKAPTGGSVNLAGLPLLLLAIRQGPVKTLIGASVVFGLTDNLFDGYGLQTYPFDYFIAFTGYMGPSIAYMIFEKTLLKDNKSSGKELGCIIASLVIGCVTVMITRLIGSGLSSYIYFIPYLKSDLVENFGLFGAIFIYNIAYIGPSAALSLVGALLLAKPMQMINHRFPVKKAISEEE